MLDIETYCGICGAHCGSHTDLECTKWSVRLTLTCPSCSKEIDTMVQKIEELNEALEECRKECENGNN